MLRAAARKATKTTDFSEAFPVELAGDQRPLCRRTSPADCRSTVEQVAILQVAVGGDAEHPDVRQAVLTPQLTQAPPLVLDKLAGGIRDVTPFP